MCDGFGGLRSLPLFVALSFGTASCLVTGDNFGGRVCKTDSDCPQVAGYLCASTALWPQAPCAEGETTCICEVQFPPAPGGIALDGGMMVIPDAGPPPDFCREIKPIIGYSCVQTCHGSQMQVQNAPTDFRLDYWEPGTQYKLADGGPGLPGISSKIERIDARTYDDWRLVNNGAEPMPPKTHPIQPSREERELIHKWIDKFGAPPGDLSCEVLDAGSDAGTSDGGSTDGGADAGPPPSFATDVLPILTQRCAPCHTTMSSGTLSLTPANAYNQLVNVQVSTTCMPAGTPRMRVLPNAPNNSQMWLKLSDNANKCGNFMPRTNPPLMPLSLVSPAQFAIIDRWIRTGARP